MLSDANLSQQMTEFVQTSRLCNCSGFDNTKHYKEHSPLLSMTGDSFA